MRTTFYITIQYTLNLGKLEQEKYNVGSGKIYLTNTSPRVILNIPLTK